MNNIETLQETITSDLGILKNILKKYSSYSITGWCISYHLVRANTNEQEKLHSPAKQLSFLLGLMLSTIEPDTTEELDESKWYEILEILNRLFNHYWLLYLPEEAEKKEKLSDKWFEIREVSMIAFFNYFNSGLLASVEQVKDRIQRYLVPFDNIIDMQLGISLSTCLIICDFIMKRLHENMERLISLQDKEKALREELIKKHMGTEWSIEEMRKEAIAGPYMGIADEYYKEIMNIGKVDINELKEVFGDAGCVFSNTFTIERGRGSEIRYPTDESIFDVKPIIICNDNNALCPITNSLYLALNTLGEKILLGSDVKKKYLRARDKLLEEEALSIFTKLVSDKASIFSSVYETVDNHFEHDIIIDDEILTLIIEAKASPPIIPFRDPEKAFLRIKDAFKSDTGIQKAFEQANRIIRKLKKNENIDLFNKDGKCVYTLKNQTDKLQIGICVTRDNFGSLATDLSLLLEKEKYDKYPWAVNILDLKNIYDGWTYLKLDEIKFRHFLEQRILLHGKVKSNDELEYAGFFIMHDDFSSILTSSVDMVQLDPHYSDIFDDIYKAQYHDGPPIKVKTKKEPVVTDLKRSIVEGKPVFIKNNGNIYTKKNIGRNEPCPCGSGKKYKRCCGR